MSIWLNGISSYMAIASISYIGNLIVHKEHNKIAPTPLFQGFHPNVSYPRGVWGKGWGQQRLTFI
jgi:hypothetical protein